MELLIDGNRGIYIPKFFAENLDLTKIKPFNSAYASLDIILHELKSGPDSEYYWDCWDALIDDLEFIDGSTLYQDGDLWAIAEGETIETE